MVRFGFRSRVRDAIYPHGGSTGAENQFSNTSKYESSCSDPASGCKRPPGPRLPMPSHVAPWPPPDLPVKPSWKSLGQSWDASSSPSCMKSCRTKISDYNCGSATDFLHENPLHRCLHGCQGTRNNSYLQEMSSGLQHSESTKSLSSVLPGAKDLMWQGTLTLA